MTGPGDAIFSADLASGNYGVFRASFPAADRDGDAEPDATDLCPYWPDVEGQIDSDGNGRRL